MHVLFINNHITHFVVKLDKIIIDYVFISTNYINFNRILFVRLAFNISD